MPSFIQRLTRRKHVSFGDTELPRVLTTFDLTLLGIGSTVGVGFYVLAGEVARSVAGPAVIISFLIAAVASVFAGLCYAEFGARVPKAGSAYVYSYVCVGEFVAFIIGWNLVLEYIIGTASVARGYSGYVDGLANYTISAALEDVMPIQISFLSPYPDFLSFALIVILSVLLSLGVKESSILNSVCTGITLIIVTYTIIALATQADGKNWELTPEELNETCPEEDNHGRGWGIGGFVPYGFAGIMQGAATCFFGFVGFDCIATTGEEAIKPERSIPISISLSLFFVFIAYFGMSCMITLALPYCLQDAKAPLVSIFEGFGWQTSKWIVSIGALFGFSASLFGILLPLPRVIYAMADDGMLFRYLAKINKRFKTPAIATIASGIFAALMAMFFHLSALVDMMSIGTLLAYTIVALSVMLLRYSNIEMCDWKSEYTLLKSSYTDDDDTEPRGLLESGESFKGSSHHSSIYTVKDYLHQCFNVKCFREPTDLTASLVSYATLIFCFLASILGMLLVFLQKNLSDGETGAIVAVASVFALVIANVVIIACQPQSKKTLPFKVPLVPWVPAVSSIINLYLMFNLSSGTWIRFGIWMAIGLPIYFGYGIWHSSGSKDTKHRNQTYGIANPDGPENVDERNISQPANIPDIDVQPPTPRPSASSTPAMPHRVDASETKMSICDSELERAFASLDQAVESERSSSFASGSNVSYPYENLIGNDVKNRDSDVQSRELPPLPVEEAEDHTVDIHGNSSFGDEPRIKGESVSSCDPHYESLESVLTKKEQIAQVREDEYDGPDPGYETLEDVKSEQVKRECDVYSSDEEKQLIMSSNVKSSSVDDTNDEDEPNDNKTFEPPYASVKKTKPKPHQFKSKETDVNVSDITRSPDVGS